jgi:hypothetical protein
MRVEPRKSWRSWRLGSGGMHRIGPRILAVAVLVAAVWVGAILVTDRIRAGEVSTWTGPDATVQSGYALGRCQFPAQPADRQFPVWLRYEDRLYRFADRILPVTDDSITRGVYARSGYTLDRLTLLTMEDTPGGQARDQVMLRATGAEGGAVYTAIAECE